MEYGDRDTHPPMAGECVARGLGARGESVREDTLVSALSAASAKAKLCGVFRPATCAPTLLKTVSKSLRSNIECRGYVRRRQAHRCEALERFTSARPR